MVKHAQITTVTSLVQKIIRSTVRGVSSLRHDHGHKSHYTTLATLSHIKLQFKNHGLGMRLFGKCPTLRKSPRLPVLSINNSTGAVIIPKNVIHYRVQRWTFDPSDVSLCDLVKWGETL